jgi:hypothetical protein
MGLIAGEEITAVLREFIAYCSVSPHTNFAFFLMSALRGWAIAA